MSVQYRLTLPGKNPDVVDGPDDADLVIAIPLTDVGSLSAPEDATVAFMQGKLKASGPSNALFALLRSGDATAALSALATSRDS